MFLLQTGISLLWCHSTEGCTALSMPLHMLYYSIWFLYILFSKSILTLSTNSEGQRHMFSQPRYSCPSRPSLLWSLKIVIKILWVIQSFYWLILHFVRRSTKINQLELFLLSTYHAKCENDIITEEYAENSQTSNFNNFDFCCFAVLCVVFMFYNLITIYKGIVVEFLFYQ